MDRIEIKWNNFSARLTGIRAIRSVFVFMFFVMVIFSFDPSIAVYVMSFWKKIGA